MRWTLALAALAATTFACDSPTGPTASEGPALEPDGTAVSAQEAVVARASGSAHREVNGSPVILSFSATKRADGSVEGEYSYHDLGGGVSLRVDVTCLTVVDGNKAWIGGVAVASSIPVLVGRVSYFYTFDNGEGAAADSDVVSLVRANDVAGADQEFCTTLPTVLPDREVLRGNVNVAG